MGLILSGYEYCKFVIGQPSVVGNTIQLKEKSFNNLWNFVLENQGGEDSDKVLSIGKSNGQRYIRAGRYVGTLQTKDGQIIEILPKITSGNTDADKAKSRSVFRKMLATCYDHESKRLSDVSLETKKDFPIFDYYIERYIEEVERLFNAGLKKNYSRVQGNEPFLRGKLLVSKQLSKNAADQAHFQIEYSKYIDNIPQNRIIVSTLHKLARITTDPSVSSECKRTLTKFEGIPPSQNINADLLDSMNSNRLFSDYKNLIRWSSQFLLNKGFTSFNGDTVNCALLFDASKLFESFIAHIFKKYSKDYSIVAQDQQYYLIYHVDAGKVESLFKLRPDIVAKPLDGSSGRKRVILDTKWKTLNDSKNSGLSIADLYQLYAYGHKYISDDGLYPNLVLIYPATSNDHIGKHYLYDLKEKIDGIQSFGENPLGLMISHFDLSTDEEGYSRQVLEILLSSEAFVDDIKRLANNLQQTDSE